MRLERLDVTGFGRLHQRRFDFGERMTVVLGPNESGKSTLHRAIRAALYGLDAGGPGRPRERSDWARWLPWAPGRFGLTLTYRLDGGRRLRVAQSFDHDRVQAQVHELGGGDVTQQFRIGRTVCPGRFHLGIDEAVFCAAAWLGEESLPLSAAEAAPQQAGRLREALERLVDAGAEGTTAGEAMKRLGEALQRVGSERRSQSPLGVAVAQARRLDAEIATARLRLASFAGEEERLRGLEREAGRCAGEAVAAQRAWIAAGSPGWVPRRPRSGRPARKPPRSPRPSSSRRPTPASRWTRRPRSSPSGASCTRCRERLTRPRLAGPRRRSRSTPSGAAAPRSAPAFASWRRHRRSPRRWMRRTASGGASRSRPRSPAAIPSWRSPHETRRCAARSRSPDCGSVDPDELGTVARLVDTARAGRVRVRVAFGLLAALTLVGAAAAAGLAASGDRLAALAAVISAVVAVAGLAAAGALAQRAGSAARRDLEARLPGVDLSPAGLETAGIAPSRRAQPPP